MATATDKPIVKNQGHDDWTTLLQTGRDSRGHSMVLRLRGNGEFVTHEKLPDGTVIRGNYLGWGLSALQLAIVSYQSRIAFELDGHQDDPTEAKNNG